MTISLFFPPNPIFSYSPSHVCDIQNSMNSEYLFRTNICLLFQSKCDVNLLFYGTCAVNLLEFIYYPLTWFTQLANIFRTGSTRCTGCPRSITIRAARCSRYVVLLLKNLFLLAASVFTFSVTDPDLFTVDRYRRFKASRFRSNLWV